MKGTTLQQRMFVDEYLRLRKKNATQAAINAGYSPKSASSQASQLLNKANVAAYLKEREDALAQELREEFFFDALEARKEMYRIMIDPSADNRDKISVAKDFLDRAGFKPTDKTEVDLTTNDVEIVITGGDDDGED